MESIRVLSDFHTAHRQLGYPGKCTFVHGHTWKGEFVISTDRFPRDDLDMSLDFGDLKRIMKELDHKILVVENDRQFCDSQQFDPAGVVVLPGKGPSVENVADYCLSHIEAVIRGKYPNRGITYHLQVTIEETDHNFFISESDLVI